MEPGQALVFSGSSQWHYRDAIPETGNQFCTLLFFHFIPRGAGEIVDPANWARWFGIPELAAVVGAMADTRGAVNAAPTVG